MFRKITHALAMGIIHVLALFVAHGIAVEIGGLIRDEFVMEYATKIVAIAWQGE